MKVCCRCGVERQVSQFFKSKRTKDGFYPACKLCMKAYRCKPEVRAGINAYRRKYYKTPEGKVKIQGYQQAYGEKLKEAV